MTNKELPVTMEALPSVMEILQKIDNGSLELDEVISWGDKMGISYNGNLPQFIKRLVSKSEEIKKQQEEKLAMQTAQAQEEDSELTDKILEEKIVKVSLEILEDESKKDYYLNKAKALGLTEPFSLSKAIRLVLREEISGVINAEQTNSFVDDIGEPPSRESFDRGLFNLKQALKRKRLPYSNSAEKVLDKMKKFNEVLGTVAPVKEFPKEIPKPDPKILEKYGMKLKLEEIEGGKVRGQWLEVPENFPRGSFKARVSGAIVESDINPYYNRSLGTMYIPGRSIVKDDEPFYITNPLPATYDFFVEVFEELGEAMGCNKGAEVHSVEDAFGKLKVNFWIEDEKTVCMQWERYEKLEGNWNSLFNLNSFNIVQSGAPEFYGTTIYTPGHHGPGDGQVAKRTFKNPKVAKEYFQKYVELVKHYVDSCEFLKNYGLDKGKEPFEDMKEEVNDSEEISQALSVLIKNFKKDEYFAHTWHCNVAMAFQDACGGDKFHKEANQAASIFMKNAFDVETSGVLGKEPSLKAKGELLLETAPNPTPPEELGIAFNGMGCQLFGKQFEMNHLPNGNLVSSLGSHSNPTIQVSERDYLLIKQTIQLLQSLTNPQ